MIAELAFMLAYRLLGTGSIRTGFRKHRLQSSGNTNTLAVFFEGNLYKSKKDPQRRIAPI